MPSPIPRIVIGAPSSDSGKTTVTLALLAALQDAGMSPVSFKCGPDYIDPMFHSHILGISSYNLDIFLSGRGEQGASTVRGLFCHHAEGTDIALIEGVMGFYDGAGVDSEASTYDVARTIDAPVVLVLSERGAVRSIAATVKGFKELEPDSHVAGVILNNTSKMLYQMLAPMIERETGVKVLGYLPKVPEATIESRHLGLVTAEEIGDLKARLAKLGEVARESIDLAALMELARSAPALDGAPPEVASPIDPAYPPRIAVARDKAFCFYYADNLELLERLGAELVAFSPLSNEALPEDIDGIYLGGGYPELYEEQLAANDSMRTSIREANRADMPLFAECGGFMYLLDTLDGRPMAGVIEGEAFETSRLQRFGYTTLTTQRDTMLAPAGTSIQAHEFHYWDSNANGDACIAAKDSGRSWECIVANDHLWAGFPHFFFYGNPLFAQRFVAACSAWRAGKGA